jgi:hypothetical protein
VSFVDAPHLVVHHARYSCEVALPGLALPAQLPF